MQPGKKVLSSRQDAQVLFPLIWNQYFRLPQKIETKKMKVLDDLEKTSTLKILDDIETVHREVGIKIGSKEDWCSQYKRLNHTFIIEDDFDAGDSLIPSVYVDKVSSIDTINIEECDFYIEHINIQ